MKPRARPLIANHHLCPMTYLPQPPNIKLYLTVSRVTIERSNYYIRRLVDMTQQADVISDGNNSPIGSLPFFCSKVQEPDQRSMQARAPNYIYLGHAGRSRSTLDRRKPCIMSQKSIRFLGTYALGSDLCVHRCRPAASKGTSSLVINIPFQACAFPWSLVQDKKNISIRTHMYTLTVPTHAMQYQIHYSLCPNILLVLVFIFIYVYIQIVDNQPRHI